jgi:sugar phosphate isomerase/epimerase
MPNITTSFITANYVARALNYRGPHDWMSHDDATLAAASPETFLAIVQDIVSAGYEAIDVWTAHCHYINHARDDYLEQIKGYCSQFDLTITSYAGGFEANTPADVDKVFRFMKQLGAPIFAGGISSGLPPAQLCPIVNDACLRFGVYWAFENHPAEKNVDDILAAIDDGIHSRIGVALDTGWCATNGFDAADAAKRLIDRGKLDIVHLKDVKEPGKHDTCPVGEGIVNCEKVVRTLLQSHWQGNLTIEHEPFDHDPTDEVRASRERVEQWLRG